MRYDAAKRFADSLDPRVMAERFWSKVEKTDGCWIWRAALEKRGYGWVRAFRKTTFAHRVAWRLEHGAWPDGVVRHSCDTPACVNPAHLLVGTQLDNIQDMVDRGRVARGSARSDLTDEDVISIRRRFASGETQTALGREYGVQTPAISRIVHGVRWGHIKEGLPQ